MKKLLLFGGTTEGRLLAQTLDETAPQLGLLLTVSVATEYGREVLSDLPHSKVRQGRLDAEALKALLQQEKFCLVIDATHPYAAEVSRLLREACRQQQLPLWRCIRPAAPAGEQEGCHIVADAAAAAAFLQTAEGAVLLATGAKELSAFASLDPKRLYARVLPTVAGIEACLALGLPHSHILALQGPFSQKLNEAILEQYGIRFLVTKDGGAPGGFAEKLAAARALGVQVVLLRRPETDAGLSAEEILARLPIFLNEVKRSCAST